MRAESTRHVVVINDDDPNVNPDAFDTGFLALDPGCGDHAHHWVVSHANFPAPANIGQPYIELTNERGGVTADLRDHDFHAVFDALSAEVIGGQGVARPGEEEWLDQHPLRLRDHRSGIESAFESTGDVACSTA